MHLDPRRVPTLEDWKKTVLDIGASVCTIIEVGRKPIGSGTQWVLVQLKVETDVTSEKGKGQWQFLD